MKKFLLVALTSITIGGYSQTKVVDMPVGSSINLGSQVSSAGRTFECWFKLNTAIDSTNVNPNPILYRKVNSGSKDFGIYFGPSNWPGEEGRLVFNKRASSTNNFIVSDSNNWEANRWYHVAAVIDTILGMQLYIDGIKQQDTNTLVAAIGNASASSGGYLRAGTWSGNNGGLDMIDGRMDKIAVWEQPLSPAEILTHADRCYHITYPTTGLRGYYNFETDTVGNTTIHDLSGNFFSGSRGSSTFVTDTICTIQLVTSILVQGQGGNSTISVLNGTLQMEATILPSNAVDGSYTWTVINVTGTATIDANGILSASTNGTVAVTATANDGSGVTGNAVITISHQSTGIKVYEKQSITIYPNPTSGQVTFKANEKIRNIVLLNTSGQKVSEYQNVNTINISNVTQGVYFVKIMTESGSFVIQKLIKK